MSHFTFVSESPFITVARVGVQVPTSGSEPAAAAVTEPSGRVPHGVGAAAGWPDTEQRVYPTPSLPWAVPHGGQLQQGK